MPILLSAAVLLAGNGLQVTLVSVRADIEGEPAPGYRVAGWSVDPPRVWLAGARSEVLRLAEVVTESIDVAGLDGNLERDVRLLLGGGNVWMEEKKAVTVAVRIEVDPEAQAAIEAEKARQAEAAEGGAGGGAAAPEGAG